MPPAGLFCTAKNNMVCLHLMYASCRLACGVMQHKQTWWCSQNSYGYKKAQIFTTWGFSQQKLTFLRSVHAFCPTDLDFMSSLAVWGHNSWLTGQQEVCGGQTVLPWSWQKKDHQHHMWQAAQKYEWEARLQVSLVKEKGNEWVWKDVED